MRWEKHSFIDYLKTKNAYSGCPCCKSCDWRILIHDVTNIQDQRLIEFSLMHLIESGKVIHTAAVAMACGNCGFVRMHLTNRLTKTVEGPLDREMVSQSDATK